MKEKGRQVTPNEAMATLMALPCSRKVIRLIHPAEERHEVAEDADELGEPEEG